MAAEILSFQALRATAWLLLIGGLLFWAGAFTPPYKQWTASDTGSYLQIIQGHRTNWMVINGFFTLGVLVTILGISVLTDLFKQGSWPMAASVAQAAFLVGTVFWVINLAFRLTVTLWAAKELGASGAVPEGFKTWMDWSNFLFSMYMVLAYLCIGLLGLCLQDLNWLPSWVHWFFLIFGFGGILGFLIRIPLFDPPLMIHLPFMILGIYFLRQLFR